MGQAEKWVGGGTISLEVVVERSLSPLVAELSATLSSGTRAAHSRPVLSWGAVALGHESALPSATVTWPGHGRPDGTSIATSAGAGTTAAAGMIVGVVAGTTAAAGSATGIVALGADGGTGVTAVTGTTAAVPAGAVVAGTAAPVGAAAGVTAGGGAGDMAGGAQVRLDRMPVGASLVGVLADAEVADLADDVLLDVAARWQDVISWATAMQSRALGEIARRGGVNFSV
jgi:hypothetical protein